MKSIIISLIESYIEVLYTDTVYTISATVPVACFITANLFGWPYVPEWLIIDGLLEEISRLQLDLRPPAEPVIEIEPQVPDCGDDSDCDADSCNRCDDDAPVAWQMSFQEAATPIMEGIISLHNDVMGIIVFITFFVCWMLFRTIYLFTSDKNPTPLHIVHGTTIELAWTILPSFILMFIAVPSFALLYSMDEVIDPAITIKAIGHQWYWSYEYSDYNTEDGDTIEFDSYMVQEDDLELGQLRLLEVDNRVVVPTNTHIRVLITSGDVIHAWAIPSLGVKADALPGRLNQAQMFVKREGVFHGQCSELCGVNHGFMPIVVEAVSLKDYVSWVSSKLENN